jgi:ribosomal 50S subunit-associated protein YjgA (DUF615 family)
MEEVISLDKVDIGGPSISLDDEPKSVDFGMGLELLMNDKHKKGGDKPSKDAADELKKELDDITSINLNSETLKQPIADAPSVSIPTIEIGKSTLNMDTKNEETWDGYNSIDNMKTQEAEIKKMSASELLREKFDILKKLEKLEEKGASLSKKYTMESDLLEMKGEYENIIAEKEKDNSVKFQGKMLTTLITGLEFLNNRFDPFDVKLDGWSEQINENLDDYDEIFSELHEKYKSKAKMAPEIKLLFQLATSGMMIHMSNTLFKSAIPGMDDIMRQNPDLMNHFTKAAVNSMQQTAPGLSNFMNDFGMSHTEDTNEIRSRRAEFPPASHPPPPAPQQTSVRQPSAPRPTRPEMKGPDNINSILDKINSGNKKIDTTNNNSTISLEELNDLDIGSTNKVKSRGSRRKSDKNTITLSV